MPDKLTGLHPDLQSKLDKILAAMRLLGFELVVTQGVRTTAQQQALYAQGRTAPGKVVTNADGVKNKSNHQLKADGYGHAVDVAFRVNGKISWDEKLPWKLYGEMAKSLGLVWGGDWVSIKDKPHVELP